MDAMDVNWCLTCSRHIDADGSAPYCSRECYASDRPASSSAAALPSPAFRPFHSPAPSESIPALDDSDDEFFFDRPAAAAAERSSWIGRGHAGIHAWARAIPPGPPSGCEHVVAVADLRPPRLLQTARRPVPPSLCMSKTTPSPCVAPNMPSAPAPPAGPSRLPAAAAAASSCVPSLSSQCPTNTSVVSLTTPSSSVPAASPIEEPAREPCPPSAATARPGLIGALTAQVRSWAAPKDGTRSETVTRQPRAASAIRARGQPRHHPAAVGASSPASYEEAKDGLGYELWAAWGPAAEKLPVDDDHPVFRARGRRCSRFAS